MAPFSILGLKLTILVIKSQIHLVRQSLYEAMKNKWHHNTNLKHTVTDNIMFHLGPQKKYKLQHEFFQQINAYRTSNALNNMLCTTVSTFHLQNLHCFYRSLIRGFYLAFCTTFRLSKMLAILAHGGHIFMQCGYFLISEHIFTPHETYDLQWWFCGFCSKSLNI